MKSPGSTPAPLAAVDLNDKWTRSDGRVFLNGTQALARILLLQKQLDARGGLNTAGYISGYRGSPLGGVDMTLWSIADRLTESDIRFEPGLNEDIAVTAVRGTQQLDAVPDPKFDGVFAAWYGKGPGVDRSGDALKHGNFKGAHRNGGVLLFYGDDHAGKSSTVSHHSEQALAASFIPSLYPSNVGEIITFGLLGYAISRYSGSWVGLKCVNEVVEQTATVDLALDSFAPVMPPYPPLPPAGIHCREGGYAPLLDESIVVDHRLPLVQAFVRANRIDRTRFRSAKPRLGLITAGKSYGDTRQALALLGLSDARAAELGISLYKVGCIWPLETEQAVEFSRDHAMVFVIEEKKSFIELQLAAALVNRPDRPILVGKKDEDGATLLSGTLLLEPVTIALAIASQLAKLGIETPEIGRACVEIGGKDAAGGLAGGLPRRVPFFCSGCPHSRSTRLPDGSVGMSGIGCHSIVLFSRPAENLYSVQMGGEGANWLGLAPFTNTAHIFQNMGDGTYFHSGLLAIRAAVAAGVNITYKILYNDAVAMTGGQPVDGPISVAQIAHQLEIEGVRRIVLLSDNPDAHLRAGSLPAGVDVRHRDLLDSVQCELRDVPGCTILIYEQTCAAEKRRRRKQKRFPDPPKRLFIAPGVCEGCGDCSVQSTCVSLTPRETDLGTKRQIDQSSCNKDYSCQNGFCPSFITVHGAEPRKPVRAELSDDLFDDLPVPVPAMPGENGYNLMVTGIGGTGVVTVAAMIGMAAHLEGRAASIFDMAGLAQKNGAVFSHVRIAASPEHIRAQRIGRGETDLLLAFDMVAASADEAFLSVGADRSRAVVNADVAPTMAFQFDRDATIASNPLLERLGARIAPGELDAIDATQIATQLLGDSIGTNLFLVGYAMQRGRLPVGAEAIERAVRLNGTAVAFNLDAFRLGRLFAHAPHRLHALLPVATPLDPSLDALIGRREDLLTRYQDASYAARYRRLVDRVRAVEQHSVPGVDTLSFTVARQYARLLAYKDEYEVARLLTDPELQRELDRTFANGARLAFNMAPPIFGGASIDGRPPKREFNAWWMRPLLGLLARMKRLRGTALDPFGRTRERRMERELIGEYEALVEEVLPRLAPGNHVAGVALLNLVEGVRGFGPVKEKAICDYRAALPAARAAYEIAPLAQAA